MHVQYVGPFDAVTITINGVQRDVQRRELVDVADEFGARLLDQAVWADEDYDVHDAEPADIIDWVGDDHGLAQVALAEEAERDTPRAEVVDHCRAVLGVAATPEDLGVDVEALTAAMAAAAAALDVPEPVHSLKPRSIRKAKELAAAHDETAAADEAAQQAAAAEAQREAEQLAADAAAKDEAERQAEAAAVHLAEQDAEATQHVADSHGITADDTNDPDAPTAPGEGS